MRNPFPAPCVLKDSTSGRMVSGMLSPSTTFLMGRHTFYMTSQPHKCSRTFLYIQEKFEVKLIYYKLLFRQIGKSWTQKTNWTKPIRVKFATCPSPRNGFSRDTGRPTQETSRTSVQSAWGHFLSETVAPDISRLSTRSSSWVRTSATWWSMSIRTWSHTPLCRWSIRIRTWNPARWSRWSMRGAPNIQLYPCEIFHVLFTGVMQI